MIDLKGEFTKKGITYKQVIKCKDIVIYELNGTNTQGNNKWFEVFRYRVKKPDRFHDDDYVVYPSNEDFGLWAWSCSSVQSVHKVINKHFPDIDQDEILPECLGV